MAKGLHENSSLQKHGWVLLTEVFTWLSVLGPSSFFPKGSFYVCPYLVPIQVESKA